MLSLHSTLVFEEREQNLYGKIPRAQVCSQTHYFCMARSSKYNGTSSLIDLHRSNCLLAFLSTLTFDFITHCLLFSKTSKKIMGQELNTTPNEQRYVRRYATKYTRYFYSLSIVGIILSIGAFLYRNKMPDGMFRTTAVIQLVVTTLILLFLLHLKGTPY